MLSSSDRYDYIFLGGGCASLSIIMRIIEQPQLSKKQILIIDESEKNINDRTWCFWEDHAGYFEEIVHKKWSSLFFKSENCKLDLEIEPYEYKMIRGIDFYNHCLKKIKSSDQVTFIQGKINVSEFYSTGAIIIDETSVETQGAIVFNSLYQRQNLNKGHHLLQHFTGWIIESNEDVFSEATLMDFSVSQEYGTAFFYVLPFNKTSALVEFTLFTKQLLEKESYELELKRYISETLDINKYTIREREFGIIPMSSSQPAFLNHGAFQIGVAGGLAKGSTGYAFKFIQEHSENIVEHLINGELPQPFKVPPKFLYYDKILLHILSKGTLSGKSIFQKLFEKNKAKHVFKFLDNKSNLKADIKIISSLPTYPFLKAAIKELLH